MRGGLVTVEGSLDDTAAQVGAGELALRARVDGSDDAFDRFARRFNGMLDRIGELLDGVRHATDHIAHDLRTPLTRLRNRLDRMREDGIEATPAQAQMLDAAIAETRAQGAADIGKLMGALKPKLAGQADMGLVSRLVKSRLSGG